MILTLTPFAIPALLMAFLIGFVVARAAVKNGECTGTDNWLDQHGERNSYWTSILYMVQICSLVAMVWYVAGFASAVFALVFVALVNISYIAGGMTYTMKYLPDPFRKPQSS